jgi:ring-1,2-phenylacetyl-CoA epoxidase subunit PaaA
MVQDAVNRWWWKCLAMFGPRDTDSPTGGHTGMMAWGIKRFSNDDLRQKFVDMPPCRRPPVLGVTLPDPDLKWNEERAATTTSARSTGTSSGKVINGHGPCNQPRRPRRVSSHEQGAWVREAATAHAAKQRAACQRRR